MKNALFQLLLMINLRIINEKIKISTELRKHKISSFQIEEGLNIIRKSDYESKINGLIYQKWHQLLGEEIFDQKKKTSQFVVVKVSLTVFAQFDQMVVLILNH